MTKEEREERLKLLLELCNAINVDTRIMEGNLNVGVVNYSRLIKTSANLSEVLSETIAILRGWNEDG